MSGFLSSFDADTADPASGSPFGALRPVDVGDREGDDLDPMSIVAGLTLRPPRSR
jgi:hypothetical protein